jgi:hypothetical protein
MTESALRPKFSLSLLGRFVLTARTASSACRTRSSRDCSPTESVVSALIKQSQRLPSELYRSLARARHLRLTALNVPDMRSGDRGRITVSGKFLLFKYDGASGVRPIRLSSRPSTHASAPYGLKRMFRRSP